LVDGEAIVWESNTILRYLSNKLAGGAALYPSEPAARSQVERWMDWQLASLNAPYLGVFREAKKKEDERAASFAADAKELSAQLEILEKGMGGWIGGANFSIADICLGPIIDRALAFPVSLPALPGVRAWRDRVVTREAYKKSKG
jgi:glutathione S-transferase